MARTTLKDTIVLLTGASSGIGLAAARAFGREGARLAIVSRDERRLRPAEQDLRSAGCDVVAIPADVGEQAEAQRLVAEVRRRLGPIDVLVCNAGIYVRTPAARARVEDFERSMGVNFYGALYLIRETLPSMLERKSGHVIVVSSVDGKKGLPLDAPYVAAKSALTGYMDVLRQELRGTGVTATTILPGRVDTPMIEHLRVPRVSRKAPVQKVARVIMRAAKRKSGEVVVPFWGPKTLIVLNSFSPRLGDLMVRLFRLQGMETGGGANPPSTTAGS